MARPPRERARAHAAGDARGVDHQAPGQLGRLDAALAVALGEVAAHPALAGELQVAAAAEVDHQVGVEVPQLAVAVRAACRPGAGEPMTVPASSDSFRSGS
jgi:hypothetical protein